MKEQYDFGERKSLKENRIVSSNSNIINQYDFITEANLWAKAAKGAMSIANTTYTGNMLRGAGVGAAVGAVGNVAKNMVKRDDDPTKKGIIGSALSGATKGAGVGAVAGAGARFAARTSLGMQGIHAMGQQALQQAQAAGGKKGVQNAIAYMNSGAKSNALGRRFIGFNKGGDLTKAAGNRISELGPGASRGAKAKAFFQKGIDFDGKGATVVASSQPSNIG